VNKTAYCLLNKLE